MSIKLNILFICDYRYVHVYIFTICNFFSYQIASCHITYIYIFVYYVTFIINIFCNQGANLWSPIINQSQQWFQGGLRGSSQPFWFWPKSLKVIVWLDLVSCFVVIFNHCNNRKQNLWSGCDDVNNGCFVWYHIHVSCVYKIYIYGISGLKISCQWVHGLNK